jgi:hypothetical protein
MHRKREGQVRWSATRTALVALLTGTLPACNILDVENPNNVTEESLTDASVANALASGALARTALGVSNVTLANATASDEIIWIGSRDAWQQLDFGILLNPENEFTDTAFIDISVGRWLADEAVRRIEGYQQAGTLKDPNILARAYLYAAAVYTSIADMHQDFVLTSDALDPVAPVGAANMSTLYDQAIDYLTKALEITSTGELGGTLYAMRARARHARGVWGKINPPGTIAANPLVSDAAAAADAEAALSRVQPDFKYQYQYSASSINNVMGDWVNERAEQTFGPAYTVNDVATPSKVLSIALKDPITNAPAPAFAAVMKEFQDGGVYAPYTVVSAREMHLIIAEHALATVDAGAFTSAINNLRALDGLTPFSGQVDAQTLLIHSRQANLFLQGKRLNDMYRFKLSTPAGVAPWHKGGGEWKSGSDAVARPGTRLPISCREWRSNPQVQTAYPNYSC